MLHDTFRPGQQTTCDFCDEFAGGHSNAYSERHPNAVSRIILGTAGFGILPTLGQIVEGHLLIVPRVHCCALADISSEQITELDLLLQKVRSTLQRSYGHCVFFEHGVRGVGSGGCGIDHAHMHAVPVACDGVLSVLEREFKGISIDSLEATRQTVPNNSSYLFFESDSGSRVVFPVTNLPSQYMRRLIAGCLGKPNWDWRTFGYEQEVISTIQSLSPLFSHAATGE